MSYTTIGYVGTEVYDHKHTMEIMLLRNKQGTGTICGRDITVYADYYFLHRSDDTNDRL